MAGDPAGTTTTTTPPAPSTDGTAASTPPSPSNQLALFNNQMYLIDKFAAGDFAALGPKNTMNNVPFEAPFRGPSLNDLVRMDGEGMFKWLHNITPNEYAQLIPSIQLFYVNVDTGDQVAIPLTGPSDIRGGLAAEEFYTTKTVGLKSLEMKIDGNTTPVSGKIYNISLSLIWDSLNTFFSNIPGTSLTYAHAFRSQGQAAGAEYTHKLKLSISYAGPPHLVEKYSLNGAEQAFSSYLDLVKTNLQVKENLQTQVDVSFIGYEESMLGNLRLFDFLHLNLDAQMEKNRLALASSQEAVLSGSQLVRAAGANKRLVEAASLSQADILTQVQGLNSPSDAQRRRGLGGRAGSATAVIIEPIERGTAMINALRATPGYQNVQINEKTGMVTGMGTGPVHVSQVAESGMGEAANRAIAKAMYEKYKAGENLSDTAFGGIENRGDFSAQTDIADKVRQANEDMEANIQTLRTAQEDKKRQLEAELQNMRMGQINEALKETLFKHVDKFFEIKLTSEEFEAYIQSVIANATKSYFSNDAVDRATSKPVDPNSTRTGAAGSTVTVPAGQSPQPGTSASNAQMEDLDKRIQAARTQQDSVNEQVRAFEKKHGSVDTTSAAGGGGAANQARSAAVGQMREDIVKTRAENSELIKKLNEERTALTQNSSVLGSISELERALNDTKIIEYIFLGDLLGLVVQRLQEQADSPRARKHIEETFIYLTDIALKPIGIPDANPIIKKLYKLPISILQIQKLFSDRLRGTLKNTFTLFELLQEIMNIVGLSQKRKGSLLNKAVSNPFTVKYLPCAVDEGGTKISTKVLSSKDVKHGVILTVSDTSQDPSSLDDTYESNQGNRIPHFFFGGYTNGATKGIEVSELTDDLAKVAFSRLQTSTKGAHLPALFGTTIKLIGTPFFQVGMLFYLDAPTINMSSASKWFFLKGYYLIKTLTHSYNAGGHYETVIEGMIQYSSQASRDAAVTTLPASKAAPALAAAPPAVGPAASQNVGSLPVGVPEPAGSNALPPPPADDVAAGTDADAAKRYSDALAACNASDAGCTVYDHNQAALARDRVA